MKPYLEMFLWNTYVNTFGLELLPEFHCRDISWVFRSSKKPKLHVPLEVALLGMAIVAFST